MLKMDGWESLTERPIDQLIEHDALSNGFNPLRTALENSNTLRHGTNGKT